MVRGRIIQRSCILLATLSLAWWGAAAWHLLHQKYDDLAFYQQNVAAHEFSEVANSVQALVAQGNLADARRYIIKWISEHHRSHRVIVKMENGADLIKASAQEERKEEKRVDRQVKPLSAIIWYRGAKLWTVTVWSQQNFAAKEEYSIILFRWTVLLVFTLLASFFIWYRYRYDRGDQLKSAIDQAPVDLINVDSNIALAQQQEQLALLRYFYQQLANNSTSRQIERVLEICLQMNEQGKMVISQERFGILLTECHKGFDYQEKTKQLASWVTSNKFRWMQEEFDLNSLLEQIVERFSTEIRAKGSSFTLEVDDRYQRVVVTDPSYLYHILTLILSNSVAFTTDGDIRLIISSGQRAGRNIKFVIQDSGPMIHPDLAKDALSSFTSIGEDIHPRLQPDIFIANILLQQQGEELSFVPTSDDRNRCYFCFPAVAKDEVISDDSDESIEFEQSEPSSDQNDQQPIKRQKKTNPLVLIADDSLESQNMIELFLRRLSLEVNFAFNGQEALERCQLHKYDLIFMDMQMPVLDGLTATQQIRQYEVEQGQERTPIIAISAHIKPEEVSLLLKAGCDQCLVKPLQQKHLIKIVNVYCG